MQQASQLNPYFQLPQHPQPNPYFQQYVQQTQWIIQCNITNKSDKQKKLQIQKDKVQELAITVTEEKGKLKNNTKAAIIKDNKDSLEIIDLKEKIQQINTKIELQAEQLSEKEYDITQLENWIKEIEKNETESNSLISDLDKEELSILSMM